MTRRSKHFQRELKKIALHFSLELSHAQILRQQAIGMDAVNRKMILLERGKHPHFRIVDLERIISCSLKVIYRNIDAGELEDRNIDDFIQKMSLRLDHIDEAKSIDLIFFNASENAISELPQLRYRLDKWKDTLSDVIHEQIAQRA